MIEREMEVAAVAAVVVTAEMAAVAVVAHARTHSRNCATVCTAYYLQNVSLDNFVLRRTVLQLS